MTERREGASLRKFWRRAFEEVQGIATGKAFWGQGKEKRLLWLKQREKDAARDLHGSMSRDKDFDLFGKQWETMEGLCRGVTCSDVWPVTPPPIRRLHLQLPLSSGECVKPRLTARKALETPVSYRCEKLSPREGKGLGLSSLRLHLMP